MPKKTDDRGGDNNLGVLDDSASLDDATIGFLGTTAQVNVALPTGGDDDLDTDDDVLGDEIAAEHIANELVIDRSGVADDETVERLRRDTTEIIIELPADADLSAGADIAVIADLVESDEDREAFDKDEPNAVTAEVVLEEVVARESAGGVEDSVDLDVEADEVQDEEPGSVGGDEVVDDAGSEPVPSDEGDVEEAEGDGLDEDAADVQDAVDREDVSDEDVSDEDASDEDVSDEVDLGDDRDQDAAAQEEGDDLDEDGVPDETEDEAFFEDDDAFAENDALAEGDAPVEDDDVSVEDDEGDAFAEDGVVPAEGDAAPAEDDEVASDEIIEDDLEIVGEGRADEALSDDEEVYVAVIEDASDASRGAFLESVPEHPEEADASDSAVEDLNDEAADERAGETGAVEVVSATVPAAVALAVPEEETTMDTDDQQALVPRAEAGGPRTRAEAHRTAEIALASKRLGDASRESSRESADLLTAERLLDPSRMVKPEPEGAWSHFIYTVSGRRINLGDGKKAKARKELTGRIAGPLQGTARFVPVLSRKGGVGKTTVTALLGMALADAREDRVIAVDANPDRGTLADRVVGESNRSVRDLVRAKDDVRGFHDVSALVARDQTRLDVLASDGDPRVAEAFSDSDYRDVASVAAHYYSLVLTDTGTGIVHDVMGATLDLADQLVIVSGLSVDEARLASETLTWLETNGYGDKARDAIVVLNQSAPGTPLVRLNELEAHFSTRVGHVIRIPYDSQIAGGGAIVWTSLAPETRLAARELAAQLVEGLRTSVVAR